jgi:hypothetical protein
MSNKSFPQLGGIMAGDRFAARFCHRVTRFIPGILLGAFTLVGCGDSGPTLVDAGGTVTYQGAPLPEATVVFVPEAGGLPASGRTDDQGRFTLTTKGMPGVAVSSCKVAITAVRIKEPVSLQMTDEEITANTEHLIPKTYNNFRTSGLTAAVTEDASQNQFHFELQ